MTRFDVGSRSGRMFSSKIVKRSDLRNMMSQGRSIMLVNGGRGMTGAGFLDTLKRWYHTGRKYAGKAATAYNKYAPIAESAYKTYKSDDVQRFVPKAVKNKTQQLEGFAKKHGSKFQMVDDLAKQFGKTHMSGVEEVMPGTSLYDSSKKTKEKLPGDNLRDSLFSQIKKGKSGLKRVSSNDPMLRLPANDPMAELRAKIAARRSGIQGSGINPPGLVSGSGIYPAGLTGNGIYPAGLTGSGLPWKDIFKMATKIIPAITDQIQKGSGISDIQVQKLNKIALMKLQPILSGVTRQSGGNFADIFKSIASAVSLPLKLIANIQGQSGSGKSPKHKLLKKMELHIAKVLAKAAKRKMSGRGVSFTDVLGGIAQTAAEVLPFIL